MLVYRSIWYVETSTQAPSRVSSHSLLISFTLYYSAAIVTSPRQSSMSPMGECAVLSGECNPLPHSLSPPPFHFVLFKINDLVAKQQPMLNKLLIGSLLSTQAAMEHIQSLVPNEVTLLAW